MMGWKSLILVLACASVCQSSKLDREVREAAAILKNFDVKDVQGLIAQVQKARHPRSSNSRSGHKDIDGLNLLPYHETLRKVEAGDAEINNILDHPSVTPPIDGVLRHRIVVAYTIHAVAENLLLLCAPDYNKNYSVLIDHPISKGLSSPVEAVKEIQLKKAALIAHVSPLANLIHELCGDGEAKTSVEICDLLVFLIVEINPRKYKVQVDSLVTLAKVYDEIKALEPELKKATDSFNEVSYIINGKEKLREPIFNLVHVYQNLPRSKKACINI